MKFFIKIIKCIFLDLHIWEPENKSEFDSYLSGNIPKPLYVNFVCRRCKREAIGVSKEFQERMINE